MRVELPGEGKILSLAEVAGLPAGENVARGGEAEQSSTDFDGAAARAIDGNTDGDYFDANSTTHTGSRPTPGGRWSWRRPGRSTGSSSGTAPTAASASGSPASACNCSTTPARSSGRPRWPSRRARSCELAPDDRKPVALATASADFSQDGFAVADVLSRQGRCRQGLGRRPRQKEPHEAVFALEEPLDLAVDGRC